MIPATHGYPSPLRESELTFRGHPMAAADARAAIRAVSDPIADALSGPNHDVMIDLDPVGPLPGGYPPRKPLTELARELVEPSPVATVRQLKPVHDWPHALRRSLQRFDRTTPPNPDPRHLLTEARVIAQAIEQHLGEVRIAGTIHYGPDIWSVADHFLLITTARIAQLVVSAYD
jgi:hypothetical protein